MVLLNVFRCFLLMFTVCTASDRIDGRFSFSLTTFDLDGKLNQVERASRAAFFGTPVIALCRPKSILLAAPQALPSSLMMDDGTARFCKISDSIVITHSGISADARIAVAAAQRIAVEYEFTFDECMPVESFLEELSLLFQEYTMKAGVRPFGCALIVGSLDTGELYRVEPSGSVETLGNHGVIGSLSEKLQSSLENLVKNRSISDSGDNDFVSLAKLLRDALDANKLEVEGKDPEKTQTIIVARFEEGKLLISSDSKDHTDGKL